MPPRVRAGLAAKYGLPKPKPLTGPGLEIFAKEKSLDIKVAKILLAAVARTQDNDAVDKKLAGLAAEESEALVALSATDGPSAALSELAAAELGKWMADCQLGLSGCQKIFSGMLESKNELASMHASVKGKLSADQHHRLVQATTMRLEALPLDDTERSVLEVLLCLNAYAIIPECVILGQVLAGMLEQKQKKEKPGEDDGGDGESEAPETNAISTEDCTESLENIINYQMIERFNLLVVTDQGEPKDFSMQTVVQFPVNVPQVKMSFMGSTRLYKLNPIVALAAEEICKMHNPDWRIGAQWRALDGMYAVCGKWTYMMIEDATNAERQKMLMVAPHAATVCDGVGNSSPPAWMAKYMLEEYASVLYAVSCFSGVMNDFKNAQTFGRKAISIFESSGRDQLSGFMQQVTYYLGNLCYKSAEWDDALEYHCQSLVLKKKLAERAKQSSEVDKQQISTLNASIASSHHQIGNIYGSLKKWQKATSHLKDSVKLKEEFLAADPISTASTLKSLAYVHQNKKRIKEAEECTSKELTLLRSHITDMKNPAISDCLQRLMSLRKALKGL